jgi:hypothetical protein
VYPVGIVRSGGLSRYLKADRSLLVMDCEGAEFSLLDPANDPVLLRTNIVVEVHPEFGDASEIIQRFVCTHDVTEISASIRTVQNIPVDPIRSIDMLRAADERRGPENWVFLEVKTSDLPKSL